MRQGGADRLEGEGEIVIEIGNRLDRHALHAGAGGVVAKGGASGEQAIAGSPVGLEHRVQGRIDAVEQADVMGLQPPPTRLQTRSAQQGGRHRRLEAVVFGIDGEMLGRHRPNRLHHLGTGTHGVLVEIEPQHSPPALQGSAISLQALHLGSRRRRRGGQWGCGGRWSRRGRLGCSGSIHSQTLDGGGS